MVANSLKEVKELTESLSSNGCSQGVRSESQSLAAKAAKSPRYPSPLRYPGAKREMVPHIVQLLDLNKVEPDLFVELFAGGASVSLALLWQGRVKKIGLVDADPLIGAFWKTVFWDTEWLVNQVRQVPLSVEKWCEMKGWQPCTRRERALKCLYLNRTSFSGILNDRAGPIGGKAQNGEYDIGCRFNRENMMHRIRQVASLHGRVAFVQNTDWQLALQYISAQRAAGKMAGKVVYYLDPPFFDHAERLYRHVFSSEDHVRLRDNLLAIQDAWILSYDRIDKVRELYSDFDGEPWSVGGSYRVTGPRRSVTEAMLTNLAVRPRRRVSREERNGSIEAGSAAGPC